MIALLAEALRQSEFRDGCPIGTVAQTIMDSEPIRAACDQVFRSWQQVIEEFLVRNGMRADEASELVVVALAVGRPPRSPR
ncbi:hypothetical protein EV193_103291 [Herbihabitans rhizosphaerae]|uniref:Transcriptional regulator LmrA/YxaF-like C-terminal domain-containing protein n=1 Tax=Herbihabitans rhizosphaerae TaxID=1872711 RepID=A0A4V2ETG3_9PSEU|nr:hypothetical protein [Herbihabitans rhizosphaerae]RZS40973.1 hypothetical protein EV193_103291 [Herbihabitans rhizosphaerae]